MKKTQIIMSIFAVSILCLFCSQKADETSSLQVDVNHDEANKRVDIFVDGKAFTSYLYTDTIPNLKKPVLFPVYSARGSVITRGFPLEPRKGERTDHPHQIGYWLNYGDVNGLDYWGNSAAIPADQAYRMGVIRHKEVMQTQSGRGNGILDVSMNWLKPDGQTLLEENTRFIFRAEKDSRTIDRITRLKAINEPVEFKDTKEGMLAIRVNRALEHPSDEPVTLSDDSGNQTDIPVMDNSKVTGHYLSSTGVRGMDVWGKRAKWVSLSGIVDNEKVSVVIYDHPDNVGYPTYWHARGYGLFAANPLGQNVFSEGKEKMDYSLETGQILTFKYRLEIISGETTPDKIESEYQDFLKETD
jgi:hypothetical protein